jgi:hypothetical protein
LQQLVSDCLIVPMQTAVVFQPLAELVGQQRHAAVQKTDGQ